MNNIFLCVQNVAIMTLFFSTRETFYCMFKIYSISSILCNFTQITFLYIKNKTDTISETNAKTIFLFDTPTLSTNLSDKKKNCLKYNLKNIDFHKEYKLISQWKTYLCKCLLVKFCQYA